MKFPVKQGQICNGYKVVVDPNPSRGCDSNVYTIFAHTLIIIGLLRKELLSALQMVTDAGL